MKERLFFLFLIGAAVSLPSCAEVSYRINFTTMGTSYDGSPISPFPIAGSFMYDPVLGLTDFEVNWDNSVDDVVFQFSAPLLTVGDGCNNPPTYSNSPILAFDLMSGSIPLCNGLSVSSSEWSIGYSGNAGNPPYLSDTAAMEFVTFFNGPGCNNCGDDIGAGTGQTLPVLTNVQMAAYGTWTITEVPEPSLLPPTVVLALVVYGRGHRGRGLFRQNSSSSMDGSSVALI